MVGKFRRLTSSEFAEKNQTTRREQNQSIKHNPLGSLDDEPLTQRELAQFMDDPRYLTDLGFQREVDQLYKDSFPGSGVEVVGDPNAQDDSPEPYSHISYVNPNEL